MSSRDRSLTLAGSILVVFLINPLVSGNSCEDTGFHPEKKGQYFRHHVIDTMTTQTASLCRIMCYLQESCMSYNYQPTNGSCELSGSDETEHPDDLVSSPDHVYVRRKNPCEKNPCLVHQVCKPNFKEESRSCSCSPGYEGPNCDEDAVGLRNSSILTDYGNSSYFEALTGFLIPVLQNKASTSRWVRCWHAASDGWDVTKTFHPQCDGKGPTVTIVRVGKYVFGGYSDVSWHSLRDFPLFKTLESFLFSLFNIGGYKPIKLSLKKKGDEISFSNWNYGPSFGTDLRIFKQNSHVSLICLSYKCPPSCTYPSFCSFLTGKKWFKLNDVEVFYSK